MSTQKTSENLHSATSSVASADGQEPCRLQDGVQTDLFGQEVPLVSLSQAQEIKKGKDDLRHLWPCLLQSHPRVLPSNDLWRAGCVSN